MTTRNSKPLSDLINSNVWDHVSGKVLQSVENESIANVGPSAWDALIFVIQSDVHRRTTDSLGEYIQFDLQPERRGIV